MCSKLIKLHFNDDVLEIKVVIGLAIANLMIAPGHSLLNSQEHSFVNHKYGKYQPAAEQHPKKPLY